MKHTEQRAAVGRAWLGRLRSLWYGARSSAALESGTDSRLWARRDRDALEAIAGGSARHFRFPERAERAYQAHARRSSHVARLVNSLIGLLAWGLLPWMGPSLLGVPASLESYVAMLSLSVMLPVFLVTALTQLGWPISERTEWLLIASYLVELVAVEALRLRCQQEGFAVEPSFTVIVPVAALVLPRLSLARSLTIVALYFVVLMFGSPLAPGLIGLRPTPSWFLEMVLLGIVLLGTIWGKFTARREWAASVLLDLVAHSDATTGLPNRRALVDHYRTLQRAAAAQGQRRPLFLALIDLDYFKAVNDHYGHPYGDGVLTEAGLLMTDFARRPTDMVARLGGDEFALLLDDCDAADGQRRLDALREGLRALQIEHAGSVHGVVTCSAGGVAAAPAVLLAEVLDAADRGLYEAKRAGRDRVRVEHEPLLAPAALDALPA